MAKHGKLSKLRCMIRRWHSSSRTASVCGGEGSVRYHDNEAWQAASFHGDEVPPGFRPVYVGKSRRRYLVSSCLVDHPLFKNLVDDSAGDAVVGCEVVLFDHLLWMLENAEPQRESLDELVDFYAC